jgi:hypothetical protein
MDQSQGPGTELRIRPVWSCNRPDSMSVVVLIACLLCQRVCYNVDTRGVSSTVWSYLENSHTCVT